MRRFPTWPALALLLCSAALARGQAKMAKTPFYPLEPGTSWEYRVNENVCTLRVAKYEDLKDAGADLPVTCARVEMVVGGKVVAVEHLRVTSDGVYRYALNNKVHSPPILLLKLPPDRGAKWKIESTTSGGDKAAGEFVIDRADVKVFDKTFTGCVKVSGEKLEIAGAEVSATYYFAEDYGLVKQEVTVDGQKIIMDLVKYTPPKK